MMMKKAKFSIIMPMYNAKNIAGNLKETIFSLEKFTKDYEIILVNDGSTNNCAEEAKRFGHKRVKVVGYEKNAGKGNAIKYGFKFAKGSVIVFLDSDMDLPPYQIKEMLRYLENTDVVIGSKRHPDSKIIYPFKRKILSYLYQKLISLLFGLNIKDTQVGLKIFKRKVLKNVFPKILVKRYAFDIELLVIAHKLGYRIAEAPINIRFKWGESRINLREIINMLRDTLAVFYRLKILKWYDKK